MILDKRDPKFQLLNTEDTAALLGLQPGTLSVWRSTGRYDLPWIAMRRRVLYRLSDSERFLDAQCVHRSEATG